MLVFLLTEKLKNQENKKNKETFMNHKKQGSFINNYS